MNYEARYEAAKILYSLFRQQNPTAVEWQKLSWEEAHLWVQIFTEAEDQIMQHGTIRWDNEEQYSW